jgi:hypothetical protein
MKFLLLSLMLSLSAKAAPWVTVRADHENLLYTEGERANLSFFLEGKPQNKDYSLKVVVTHAGQPRPITLSFQGRFAFYRTTALSVGSFPVEVKAYLVGPAIPPNPPWEKLVQDEVINLHINPSEEILR